VVSKERLVSFPFAKYLIKPPRGFGNALTLHDKVNQAFANDVANYIEIVCDASLLSPIRIGIDSPPRPRNNHLNRRFAERLASDCKYVNRILEM